MTPPPNKNQRITTELSRASRSALFLAILLFLDIFMVIGMSIILIILRDSLPLELASSLGTLRWATALLLPLMLAAAGSWVAVRVRDKSARALYTLTAITHLLFFPFGTIVAIASFFFIPPKQWVWQEEQT